jgi:uncharacterized protein (TIGR03083 family)
VEIWTVVRSERKALAADLKSIDEDGWNTPSLCDGWTVRDVLSHMTATATMTPAAFFPKLLGTGFNFSRMQEKGIAAERGTSPADTLARFVAVEASVKHPPGPSDSWLGETIVHSADIRRPLGISHDYPVEAVVRVADFYKNSNLLIGAKRRIDGLALQATDTDWSHGAGPAVSGSVLALVQAMTGRKAALSQLSGDGVALLQARP